MTKRIFDLEHFLLQNPHAHTVFDDFERRFSEFTVEQGVLKQKMQEHEKLTQERFSQVDKQHENMERTLETYVSLSLFIFL